jgi:hypothetical protein
MDMELKDFWPGVLFILLLVILVAYTANIPPVTQAEYMDATQGKARGDIGRSLMPPTYKYRGDK